MMMSHLSSEVGLAGFSRTRCAQYSLTYFLSFSFLPLSVVSYCVPLLAFSFQFTNSPAAAYDAFLSAATLFDHLARRFTQILSAHCKEQPQ